MMVEVEFHIHADRRDGLLMEMGRAIIASGFTLFSQRLGKTDDGVMLRIYVRGPQSDLLSLEEKLASHPLVAHYESIRQEGITPSGASTPQAAASQNGNPASPEADITKVEAVLGGIAKDYPKIFPRLTGLRRVLPDPTQGPTLHYTGTRVGAWVYKRDFALGSKLGINEAVKQIALPALKQLVGTQLDEGRLQIDSNPLCQPGSGHRTGQFFCGFLEGLLTEASTAKHVDVQEARCCSEGAQHCVFEVSAVN